MPAATDSAGTLRRRPGSSDRGALIDGALDGRPPLWPGTNQAWVGPTPAGSHTMTRGRPRTRARQSGASPSCKDEALCGAPTLPVPRLRRAATVQPSPVRLIDGGPTRQACFATPALVAATIDIVVHDSARCSCRTPPSPRWSRVVGDRDPARLSSRRAGRAPRTDGPFRSFDAVGLARTTPDVGEQVERFHHRPLGGR
jgi:hypothetical protein